MQGILLCYLLVVLLKHKNVFWIILHEIENEKFFKKHTVLFSSRPSFILSLRFSWRPMFGTKSTSDKYTYFVKELLNATFLKKLTG